MHVQSFWCNGHVLGTLGLLAGCVIDGHVMAGSSTGSKVVESSTSDSSTTGGDEPIDMGMDLPEEDTSGAHVPTCGDRVVDPGESCDEGVQSPNCDADCTFVQCGDRFTNAAAGEECDGGGLDTFQCNHDCTTPQCGDGHLNEAAGEVCEPGGSFLPDCDPDCTVPECGDGVANAAAGEACDPGFENNASCDYDCTKPACGDGLHNFPAGEQCEPGEETADCDANCTWSTCGDGYLNALSGEACDDGIETALCDDDCTLPECGDGIFNELAEECEMGVWPPANAGCHLCEFQCKPGFGNCDSDFTDGCETDIKTDPDHCGSCGNLCADNQVCVNKVCQ